MRYKVQIRVKFLRFLIRKSCAINELLRYWLHFHINYTILICICKFSLPRKGTIILGKCFLLHLHVKFLFSFEYVQSDSTAKLNLFTLGICYTFHISNICIVFE